MFKIQFDGQTIYVKDERITITTREFSDFEANNIWNYIVAHKHDLKFQDPLEFHSHCDSLNQYNAKLYIIKQGDIQVILAADLVSAGPLSINLGQLCYIEQ